MKKTALILTGLLLIIDSLWLLTMSKIHFGIILPLIIGIVFILLAIFDHFVLSLTHQYKSLKIIWRITQIGFGIWLISLAAFFGFMHLQSSQQGASPQVDAIMVLGGGIEKDQPTPSVKQRLDATIPISIKNPQAPLIVTGGVGYNDSLSEAEVMTNYLSKIHHIDKRRIFQENQSTSTQENFSNSQAILQQLQIGLDQPIAVITNDFHLARALAIGKRQGYSNLYGINAPTPLYMRYNNWLREYFAYLSGWLLNEY